MVKTITIIQLLNKIANGEEVPTKIKYEGDILKYDKIIQDYIGVSKTGSGSFFNYLFVNHQTSFFINNKVEIIEDEDKDTNIQDIEELEFYEYEDSKPRIRTHKNTINNMRIIDVTLAKKINDLIKSVKKLDKEINKN